MMPASTDALPCTIVSVLPPLSPNRSTSLVNLPISQSVRVTCDELIINHCRELNSKPLSDVSSHSKPAGFLSKIYTHSLVTGQSSTLKCTSNEGVIAIKKDGDVIASNAEYVITSASAADAGVYVCTASGSNHQIKATAVVSVTGWWTCMYTLHIYMYI